jgi:hypothetical protein
MDSLAEHRGPVGVAVVGAAAEHEPGVADPEELFITLTHESDAVTFGEVCVDHAEQTACGVERDESPGVETDDLPAAGSDDSVVHPTRLGAWDGGQIRPITDHLVGRDVGGLNGI